MDEPSSEHRLRQLLPLVEEHSRRLSQGLQPGTDSVRALNEFFLSLYPRVFRVVATHIHNVADREDCTQDVLMAIFQWLRKGRSEIRSTDFLPWVCGIAHNLGKDAGRRAVRDRQVKQALLDLREAPVDPTRACDAIEEKVYQDSLLRRGLSKMTMTTSTRNVEIFILINFQCRKPSDVAELYHLTTGRVRCINRRVTKVLRQLMREPRGAY